MASITILRQAAPETGLKWRVVAASERALAAIVMVSVSPLIAVAAVVVAGLAGRVPFIAHRRVGWRGEPLWMLKLRTMWDDGGRARGHRRGWIEYIDDGAGPGGKRADDPRVNSRFARFCRRHSIDELPQLWHVVRGEMAFVGPRPVTGEELALYYGADAEEVLRVKPGLAGLWQISGRNRLSYPERRELDLKMVREWSWWMWGRIVMGAMGEVVWGRNGW